MSKRWYLVDGHIGGDYWTEVDDDDPNQVDEIQEVCETCFDNDWIVGTAGTLKEARKLCGEHYHNDYGRDTFNEFKKLVEVTGNAD
ncbi:hypothetical protein [Lacticaseibacillus parakribbianus]|uniref:hypothetical protein n=1 Tax=Lacticaseibacillus parakribbianus TaxID=2970927 RepID=UPI0021CB9021|nr:hypothetical protein [Lacticaseibacillus parakribbianus]